jgi:hypothetical protein
MKKVFTFVALAGLGLASIGCSQPTTPPKPAETKPDAKPTSETPDATTPAPEAKK